MVLRFATPEKSVREVPSRESRPRSLASQRKALEDRMNRLRSDLNIKKKNTNNTTAVPSGRSSSGKQTLEDRMKHMARQLDQRKKQYDSKSNFNPLPSRSYYPHDDEKYSDMSEAISEISAITGLRHEFDETSASLTNEMTAKIAEIESIEDLCSKENIPQSSNPRISLTERKRSSTLTNLSPRNRRKSPRFTSRPISAKSLRASLQRPTRTAKFGNGRSANLDHNILDVKFSRKLKDLGTRTRRLNSITMMRQNFNNARAASRQRSSSVQLTSNHQRNKMISEGRTRLNSLTGVDGLTRRAQRLHSLTSGEDDRAGVVEAGRQRLNSLNSEDRDRLAFQGSLLGLTSRTLGSRGKQQQNLTSSLAKRTQRLGSVSDIRKQLMEVRDARNATSSMQRNPRSRARSVGDIKPNYVKGGLDEARAKALNERLRQLGTTDIRAMTRNAIEGTGGERKRKGIDLETIRQIKSDMKAIQNKEYGALTSSTSVPARLMKNDEPNTTPQMSDTAKTNETT